MLCYARTKRDWFSADDYRNFQLYKEDQINDIGKSFKTLVRNGYLEQVGELSRARYKITELGIEALAHVGVYRIKSDQEAMADRMRAAGRIGLPKANEVRLSNIQKEKA